MSQCLECQKLTEEIKKLKEEVMKWKGFACCNPPHSASLKIKEDPYSPIGIKFEPVIE